MGGTGSNSSVYIDRLYTDAFGGVHIRNPQIRGFDAGISHGRDETAGSAGIRLKGSAPIDVRGGTITQNDVGIESLAGGKAVIGGGVNVLNNNVTDFAYEAGSAVKVIDAYASRLFDLTHGSFRTVENDLNHLSDMMLRAQSPEEKLEVAIQLKQRLSRVPEILMEGATYDVARILATLAIERLAAAHIA